MHIDCNYNAESVDYVNTYILATPQWRKVSFATLLSTFYYYLASDAWRCLNYCTHCRKLIYIHYYSCNFRLSTFYYKSNSICKTFTTCDPCIYVDLPLSYSLITNTSTISGQESLEALVLYTTSYLQYCMVWAIFHKLFEHYIYAYILIPKHIHYFMDRLPHHITSYFWLGGEG